MLVEWNQDLMPRDLSRQGMLGMVTLGNVVTLRIDGGDWLHVIDANEDGTLSAWNIANGTVEQIDLEALRNGNR